MHRESRKPPEKRIAFLYLKTGGGHSSAAHALSRKITSLYGDRIQTFVFDPIPPRSFFAQRILQNGYRFTSHKIGIFWILLYECTKIKAVDIIWSYFVHITIKKNLKDFLIRNKIDTVVILHFLLSRPFAWLRPDLKRKPKALRIVTDPFTAHSMWFNRPEIETILFSGKLADRTRRQYPEIEGNLGLFPPVLGDKFESGTEPEAVQKIEEEIGLREGQKLLLFAGGGEGFPKGIRYISALLSALQKNDLNHKVVLVCGRDESLRKRAERVRKKYPRADFTVYGFIGFMPELMRLAHIVITKGGPATIMESLKCGKPLIIVQYLYGQEFGNMEYVKRNRFGFYAADPKEMVDRIHELTGNPALYSEITERIRMNPPKNGTAEIAGYIASLP